MQLSCREPHVKLYIDMKFTAIYDTEKMKDVEYYFSAKDLDHAINFCKIKFSSTIKILVNEDTNKKYQNNNGNWVER